MTICHKQVTIRSRAGKSLSWKRGGVGKKQESSSLLQWTRVYVRLELTVQDRAVANSASTPHGYQTPAVTSHFPSRHHCCPSQQPSVALRSLVGSYSVGHCPRTVCTAPVGGVSAAVRPAGPPCRVRAATQGPRPPLQTRDRGYFTTSTSFFSSQQTPVFWMS